MRSVLRSLWRGVGDFGPRESQPCPQFWCGTLRVRGLRAYSGAYVLRKCSSFQEKVGGTWTMERETCERWTLNAGLPRLTRLYPAMLKGICFSDSRSSRFSPQRVLHLASETRKRHPTRLFFINVETTGISRRDSTSRDCEGEKTLYSQPLLPFKVEYSFFSLCRGSETCDDSA